MSAASIMVLAVAVPFAGAILIALLHRFPNLRETATVATAALLFALVVILMTDFRPDDWPVVELFEIFPGVAVGLAVEPLGMTFAVLASALWVVTSISPRVSAGRIV